MWCVVQGKLFALEAAADAVEGVHAALEVGWGVGGGGVIRERMCAADDLWLEIVGKRQRCNREGGV